MNARELLKDCDAILKRRGIEYGKPEDLYKVTAKLISGQIGDVSPSQVCLIMAQVKLGRIANGNAALDTYVDAINYVALAWEIHDL